MRRTLLRYANMRTCYDIQRISASSSARIAKVESAMRMAFRTFSSFSTRVV